MVCTTAAVFMFNETMKAEGAYRVSGGKVLREADIARTQKVRHWYSEIGKEQVHADGSRDVGVEAPEEKEINADLFMPLLYVSRGRTLGPKPTPAPTPAPTPTPNPKGAAHPARGRGPARPCRAGDAAAHLYGPHRLWALPRRLHHVFRLLHHHGLKSSKLLFPVGRLGLGGVREFVCIIKVTSSIVGGKSVFYTNNLSAKKGRQDPASRLSVDNGPRDGNY